MAILKQSTNYKRAFFLVQTSDHRSGLTGASPTVNISKAGAAFGAATGTVTEIGNGWYYHFCMAADVDTLGDLAFHITAASADPTDFVDQVQARLLTDISIDGSGNVSIASAVKRNQALNGLTFVMTDSSTHAAKTGLTVTAQRSLDGAGFSTCANAVSELSNGVYSINLAASDMNANSIMLRFTAAGADDRPILLITQP